MQSTRYNRPVLRFFCLSLISLLVIAAKLPSFAQISNYSFSTSQSPYQSMAPDSLMGTLNSDNTIFKDIVLGFDFSFDGKVYDRVSINYDGFINFNTTTLTSLYGAVVTGGVPTGSKFFSPTATYPADQFPGVAALVADFGARGRANSLVGIKRGGAAPNRFFTAEWRNMRRWTSATTANAASDSINFKITYFEGSNDIEIHYGKVELAGPANTGQITNVGLRGDSLNRFISLSSTTSWAALSRTLNTANGIPFGQTTLPANGQKIRFSRFPTIASDLGVLSIVSPRPDQAFCLLSSQEPICVAVSNFGTTPQSTATVAYRLNGGNPLRQTFTFSPALAPGQTQTLCFTGAAGANLSAIGTYTFSAYTELVGEPTANRANDTTKNYTVSLSGPLVAPITPIIDLATSVTRSWTEGRGTQSPAGRISNWTTTFPFATASIGLTFSRTPTTQVHTEWLVSPAYQVGVTSVLIFKAAVTYNTSGTVRIGRIGDDTVRVMASIDCGNTWRVLRTFAQADVSAGVLANRLQEFRVPVGNLGANAVRVAFFGTNNSTGGDSTYRFHLDDIDVKEVLATDLGVSALVGPRSASPGCQLSGAERVTVSVSNYGSVAQSAFSAGFKFGASAPVSESFNLAQPLQPGATTNITFSPANSVNLSQPGKYKLSAWTVLAGESNISKQNDTLKTADTVRISSPLLLPSPRITDATIARNPGLYSFGRGIDAPTGTISSWGFGSINGTVIAVTMQATANSNQREWIYSPNYAITSATQLIFKAGIATTSANPAPLSGMDDDTLYVNTTIDCGSTWQVLAKFSQADVAAGRLRLAPTQYVLELPNGNSRMGIGFFADNQGTPAPAAYRLYIDDIQVKDALAFDAGITAVSAPVSNATGCASSGLTAPKFTLRNFGTAILDTASVGFSVNQGPITRQRFTLSPSLGAGQSRELRFDSLRGADLRAPGIYRISTFALYPGEDADGRQNDTVKNTTYTVTAPLGATNTETFDGYPFTVFYPTGWRSEGGPADFRLEGANGVGSTDYLSARIFAANLTSFIVSPRFALTTASVSLQFFSRIVEGDRGNATVLAPGDTVAVEVSTDCGQNWSVIYSETSGNQPLNELYTQKTISLTPYQGQEVSFRLRAKIAREPNDQEGCRVDFDSWFIGRPAATGGLKANTLSLYPNPHKGFLFLQGTSAPVAYTIIDMQGKHLAAGVAQAGLPIETAMLAKGMYMMVLKQKEGTQLLRFTKE